MFAIIKIAGKQYKVAKGDTLQVDRLEGKAGDAVTFDDVLLVAGEKAANIGTPHVKGAKVTAKILSQDKGDKVQVRRFKSKVRERKHTGFRANLTSLEILTVE